MLATISFGAVDTWAVAGLAVFAGILLVIWIADGLWSGQIKFAFSPLELPLLGLIMIACVQLLPLGFELSPGIIGPEATDTLSLDPYATRFFLIKVSICLVFMSAAYTFVSTGRRIKIVAGLLAVFGSAMAFFAIIQRLAGSEGIYGIRPTPQSIPFGSFVNQHHFAAFMVMIAGLSLGVMFGQSTTRDKRLLAGLAALITGVAVIFTSSRGGLIAFLAAIGSAAIISSIRKRERSLKNEGRASLFSRRHVLLAAGSAALVFVVVISAAYLGEGAALLRGIGPDAQADITSGRTHFWGVALMIFYDHPFLGAGFEAFGVAFTRYDTWNGLFRVEQAHNEYLQMLADGGVAGFACVAIFLYLLVRLGLRTASTAADPVVKNIAVGALAGCIGIAVHSFFDFPLRTTSNAFIFLLLVVLASRPVVELKRAGSINER